MALIWTGNKLIKFISPNLLRKAECPSDKFIGSISKFFYESTLLKLEGAIYLVGTTMIQPIMPNFAFIVGGAAMIVVNAPLVSGIRTLNALSYNKIQILKVVSSYISQ